MQAVPKYLFKVLSMEDWQASQNQARVQLPTADHDFIHFSTDEQLNRILSKYWSSCPEYVILKINTEKLPGKMIFEANPGGSAKYYHLYEGYIPLTAVEQSTIVTKKS